MKKWIWKQMRMQMGQRIWIRCVIEGDGALVESNDSYE